MTKCLKFPALLWALMTLPVSCKAADSVDASQTRSDGKTPHTANSTGEAAISLKLADDGKANLPIVISQSASPRVKNIAETLATYLGRISGAHFEIEPQKAPLSPSTPGIAVGSTVDFPALSPRLPTDNPLARETYLLRTHAQGMTVAGASDLGVEDAVWDLLYRLGYRQFFPGDKWEIVPKISALHIALNVQQRPAFVSRFMSIGGKTYPASWKRYDTWRTRNRVAMGFVLITSHSYDKIITRNRGVFEAHPEYFALVGGKRTGSKFCISNPDLRKLVLHDALHQIQQNPELDSVSLDPSDGGGWCECIECARMGSVSDRVVTLANEVAAGLQEKYPGKYVGIYAYNQHSAPPAIRVHPHVVVSIATAFIQGGYTLDQLIQGWSQKASVIGIRDYHGVFPWDQDLPGRAKGGNLTYLQTALQSYYKSGARFYTTETSDSWGPLGLGHYITARLLWDPQESPKVKPLVDDFFDKCFGPSREPMARWYSLINSANAPMVSTDLIGRLYTELDAALKLAHEPLIRSRIFDLALYTRYVELYFQMAQGKEDAQAVQRFAYGIRDTQMVYSRTILGELAPRDAKMAPTAETINSWQNDASHSDTEILKFIVEGIANNPKLSFQAVTFSDDLVPATPLQLKGDAGKEYEYSRGDLTFYTWAPGPATFAFQGKAGIIYDFRGSSKIALFPRADTQFKAASEAAILPDKALHAAELRTPLAGLQRITVSDSNGGTALVWPKGTPFVIESSLSKAARIFRGYNLYFYVPKGTRVVGGYGEGYGTIVDGGGSKVPLKVRSDYWSVPVGPGQDGKLWKFENTRGQFLLMTVPPYLARSADELLLPREVVTADMAK